MDRRSLLAIALLASTVVLTGCGKSNNLASPDSGSTNSNDQALVTEAVAASPEMSNEDVFAVEDETVFTGSTGLTAIRPLRFWRTINNVATRWEFSFSEPDSNGRPTRALVTIHRNLTGAFNVVSGDPATDSTRTVTRKPLEDHWVRRLVLLRTRAWADSAHSRMHERWRVVGTSGVEITAKNATEQIQSLRIQAGALDTTVTNPLELFRVRNVLPIAVNTPVTLTATTGNTNDIVLLYRVGYRARFTNNGDGTYTYNWTTADFRGLRHFGLNALSNGTLFDDAAPYDSKGWVLPFVVHREDDPVAINNL